jgi:hypothetical protein
MQVFNFLLDKENLFDRKLIIISLSGIAKENVAS